MVQANGESVAVEADEPLGIDVERGFFTLPNPMTTGRW
jgi:hypothetical protein